MKIFKRICFSLLLFPMVFMAIGILLIARYDSDKQLYNESVDVKATVSDCEYYSETDHDGNSQEGYKIYVDYEYNGEKYSKVYWDSLSSKKSIGEAIDIRIHPDNPTILVNESGSALVLIGLVSLALGVGFAFKMFPASFSKKEKAEDVIFVKNRDQRKKINAPIIACIPIMMALIFCLLGMKVDTLFHIGTIGFAYVTIVLLEVFN